jgi:hypothetical protein
MSRQARALAVFCAAVVVTALTPSTTLASTISHTISQTASLPLTPTDFGPGNSKVAPIVFNQFDTQQGTRVLDSVTLTFHALIRNDFGMKFVTPATITDTVATGNATTPGPTLTLFQPDGVHTLLTVKAPNDPTFLTRSVTYGSKPGQTLPQTFGSTYASTSAFYLAPAISQASSALQLTSPTDLALFSGAGKLTLPVSAAAVAKITSSSGNGMGSISTEGTAEVTVDYKWHEKVPAPQVVPEPATVISWSLAGAALIFGYRVRRRAG